MTAGGTAWWLWRPRRAESLEDAHRWLFRKKAGEKGAVFVPLHCLGWSKSCHSAGNRGKLSSVCMAGDPGSWQRERRKINFPHFPHFSHFPHFPVCCAKLSIPLPPEKQRAQGQWDPHARQCRSPWLLREKGPILNNHCPEKQRFNKIQDSEDHGAGVSLLQGLSQEAFACPASQLSYLQGA